MHRLGQGSLVSRADGSRFVLIRPRRRTLARPVAGALVALAVLACFCATARAVTFYSVSATVAVGTDPQGVAVDPSTDKIYVVNKIPGTVSVINGATNTVTATIVVGSLGCILTSDCNPIGVAVDPSTHKVYVTNSDDATVSVINGTTNTVVATIDVRNNPQAVAVDPSTHKVYVGTGQFNSVTVIDGATNTVIATTPNDSGAAAVTVDPSTHTVYAGNSNNGTVSVISGATNTITTTVELPDPIGMAVDPSTHTVYVTTREGRVSVIDGATNTVTTTIPAGNGAGGVTADPSTHTVVVANAFAHSVTVLDGASNTGRQTVAVGNNPLAAAADPSTHKVYVTNFNDNTVSVMSPTAEAELQDLSVGAGSQPTGVAYDAANDFMYVALGGSNQVVNVHGASFCGAYLTCSTTVESNFGSLQFPESVGLSGSVVFASNFHGPPSAAVSSSAGAVRNVPGCQLPAGVAGTGTGASSMVWVSCPGSGKLAEFRADGSGTPVVGTLPLTGAAPSGVAADPTSAGAVLVDDARHNMLYIYTSPSTTPSVGQAVGLEAGCAPAYLATSQPTPGAGHASFVYVACPGTSDVELVRISAAGVFAGAPVSFTAVGTPVPTRDYGIAANGSTLVVTGSGSNDAYIYTVNASGAPSGAVHVTSLPASSVPDGVAIAGNEAFIADEGSGQISVIDPPGAPVLRQSRQRGLARAAMVVRARRARPARAVAAQLARGEPLIAPRPR
jgi:YVTN family beta-propeller protein